MVDKDKRKKISALQDPAFIPMLNPLYSYDDDNPEWRS